VCAGRLAEQTGEFRCAIHTVVIDPCAPYAAGIRAALPQARIAVDHWHLVRLANEMLTQVRQCVAWQRHGRRGLSSDPVWARTVGCCCPPATGCRSSSSTGCATC
jgi:transposase